MKGLKIMKAKKGDIPRISYLHKTFIPTGFLSSLGRKFLYLLYKNLYFYKGAILLVAQYEGNVIGFISGVKDINKFFKYFYKKNILKIIPILFLRVFRFKVLKGVIELVFYPRKHFLCDLPRSELLGIVVEKKYHGKGVATKLMNQLKKEFKRMKCKKFKVVVGSRLKQAILFYEKSGFKRIGQIQIHKGIMSYIFVNENR
ncbi:MAG: GNAT family N-acetyltransferase [Spirochaetes bacterium]|nr:GNAT family N-acetyltransferase [Spirochaetota bacterium]